MLHEEKGTACVHNVKALKYASPSFSIGASYLHHYSQCLLLALSSEQTPPLHTRWAPPAESAIIGRDSIRGWEGAFEKRGIVAVGE